MIRKIFISLFLTVSLSINCQTSWPYPYVVPNIDWINYFSSRGASGSAPTAIDVNSNIYLGGYTGLGSSADLIVLKYDSTGVNSYSYSYDNGGYDNGNAIKVDASGNVFVAGVSEGSTTLKDYIIAKIQPNGIGAWTQRFDRAVGANVDEATDLAIDQLGDVYVTGKSHSGSGDFDIVTLKLDGNTGTILWQHTFNGSANLDDVATGIAVDPSGAIVYVSGYTTDALNGTDIITYALDSNSGNIYWSPLIIDGTASSNDRSNAMMMYGNDVAICGEIDNSAGGLDATLILINGTSGTIIFQKDYDGYAGGINRATALARDSAGNIAVVGTAINGSIYDYHTVLYDASGTQYARNIESTGLTSIAVDPKICNDTIAHHWYVSGEGLKATKDIMVYQITPGGNTSWKKYIDGQSSSIDAATGIGVNGIGVVYVGALSKNSSADFDITSIKINQTPVYFPVNYNFVTDTFSHSNLFYPNTCEILDTAGNSVSEVLYYTKFTYPNQFILKDRVSFCEVRDDISSSSYDTLSRVDMIFLEANIHSEPYPLNYQDDCTLNYFMSNMGTGGKTNVRGASHLLTPNIYPYIDLFCTSNSEGSKYFFVVKPGGNPYNIIMRFQGVNSTAISSGNLEITSGLGSWKLMKPRIYNVGISFPSMALSTTTVTGTNGWSNVSTDTYVFNTGTYNSALPLVIEFDMGVAASAAATSSLNCEWSTYVGGAGHEILHDIVNDSQDNLFTMGWTDSNTFPLVTGVSVYQSTHLGLREGYLDKYNNVGKRLWSTFIGGDDDDETNSLAIAANGDLYAVGQTKSTLTTFSKAGATNSLSPFGGKDLYIIQLSSNGQQLKWLTYYGGNLDEEFPKCKFDSNGNLFLVGQSASKNIPVVGTTPQYTNTNNDAAPVSADGFIAKFNSSSLISWATYLGSSVNGTYTIVNDALMALDFDSNNDLYVVGFAGGTDYPNIVNGSSTNYSQGGYPSGDAAITRFTNNGQIIWSSCMGSDNWDAYRAIKIKNNKIYAGGYSSGNGYPLVNSNNWYYSTNNSALNDIILSIWDNTDVLLHSTYIEGDAGVSDIELDNLDIIYLCGQTLNPSFPANVSQPANAYVDSYKGGGDDNFLYAIAPSNTIISWATDIGGNGNELSAGWGPKITINSSNILHLGGATASAFQFPLFSGVSPTTFFDPTFNQGFDYTITRFSLFPVNLIDGIDEKQNRLANFRVYPNPSQSIIYVKLKDPELSAFYYIYDTSGKLVKSGNVEGSESGINVSDLPPSLYILNVQQNKKTDSVKFIRNE